jgi:hypothetical protein
MVIRFPVRTHPRYGSLITELLVALALLSGALLPIAYSIVSERRMARACYHRAVAMEIVDGEMEVLAAGGWREFLPGTIEYRVHSAAATNLPPGQFLITVESDRVRLAWQPVGKSHSRPVVREVIVK